VATDPSPLALRLLDREFALEPGREYLIGSAPDCDFKVDGTDVAPHHARLVAGENQLEIIDLGSLVGTYRNGSRVDCIHLEVGDAIQFGDGAAVVAVDHGNAQIVPVPGMVADAGRRRLLAVGAAVHRQGPQSFQELMAEELRRAPWLGLSLVAHALIILLLWILNPSQPPSGDARATVNLDLRGAMASIGDAMPRTPEVVPEAEPEVPIILDEPLPPEKPEVIEDDPPELDLLGQLETNPRLTRRPDPPKSKARRSTSRARDIDGIGSAGFRQTVADLKKSGLEIIFVFDSTGSMGVTIRDTKETIAEMLEVLRALVPDARVGLITYRDRGRDEEYLLSQLPLGNDFWHASNFVQSVTADGGGDGPEAVRDALRAAFRENWRPSSKRVVVLAGDAPAHQSDWKRLISEVKSFAAHENSHVHTLVTSPRDAVAGTVKQFTRIARAGKGESLSLARHGEVLQRVLDLAFGSKYHGDLAEVRKMIVANATKTETWALDLSRRGGSDLELALRERPVDAALLNALVRMPKRRVVEQLIRLVGYEKTPVHTRQAVAWVLQRVFDLGTPPIQAATGKPISRKALGRLKTQAKRLPR